MNHASSDITHTQLYRGGEHFHHNLHTAPLVFLKKHGPHVTKCVCVCVCVHVRVCVSVYEEGRRVWGWRRLTKVWLTSFAPHLSAGSKRESVAVTLAYRTESPSEKRASTHTDWAPYLLTECWLAKQKWAQKENFHCVHIVGCFLRGSSQKGPSGTQVSWIETKTIYHSLSLPHTTHPLTFTDRRCGTMFLCLLPSYTRWHWNGLSRQQVCSL